MRRSAWRRIAIPVVVGAAAVLPVGLAVVGSRPVASSAPAPVLLAAGDIEGCGAGEATAKVIDGIDGAVAALGDNAYPSGSASDYDKCYDPTWGQFKSRTHPVPGNHDYDTPKAAGYFGYFGAAAGPGGRGYYSYDVGTWHVVALNSNCGDVDCSTERSWLDADLSAHPTPCTLAYWHHPRFSSGSAGDNSTLNTFWKVLYDHQASIVLSGHDHDYERFAPQDPNGRRDPGRGIRQFVVGTGGGAPGSFYARDANSEVRNNSTFGVLELTLRPDGYDWRFLPASGGTFTDSGSDVCSAPAAATTTTAAPTPAAPEATTPATMAEPPASLPADPPGQRETPSIPGPSTTARTDAPRPVPRRSPSGTPSATATAAPRSAPATPSAPALPSPTTGTSAPGVPVVVPGRSTTPDTAPDTDVRLVAAISGLTRAPAPAPPDRRGVTIVAVVLLLLNGAALRRLQISRVRQEPSVAYGPG